LSVAVVLLAALLVAVLRLTKALKGPAPVSLDEPVATEPYVEGTADAAGEPFEKDGRWWFERGAELLVYEAGTGEWVPAASDEPSAVTVDATPEAEPIVELVPESEPPITIGTAREPAVVAPAHENPPDGTFWKCPSCGAINGSVSATCRMCFAARP
jgi:hypothetical protein